VRYDLDALTGSMTAIIQVPIFFAALLLVRGLPALLYRPLIGARKTAVSAVMQATSLPFIVAASAIGVELGELDEATAAALIAAGLLSVLVFPASALSLLRREQRKPAPAKPAPIPAEAGM
jgi:Kef-type K+ transport system membrane component KefB